MNLGAKIAKNQDKYVVIHVIDNDVVSLGKFRPWNPWHLLGLVQLQIRLGQTKKKTSEWWRTIGDDRVPHHSGTCQNREDERSDKPDGSST